MERDMLADIISEIIWHLGHRLVVGGDVINASSLVPGEHRFGVDWGGGGGSDGNGPDGEVGGDGGCPAENDASPLSPFRRN